MKMNIKEKMACTIGGTLTTFHTQMIQMFLLFFYTDIMKLSLGFVAGLLLVVRILSGLCGPAVALITDNIRVPGGKFKPWFFVMSIPVGIFGWLTFTSVTLDPIPKMLYASITYFLYTMSMTTVGIATSGIIPAATKDIDDRISIGSYSYILIILGAMAANIGARPLYTALGNGNVKAGFSMMMGIVGGVGVAVSIFQFMNIHERFVTVNQVREKIRFTELIRIVFHNKPALIVFTNMFAIVLSNGVRSAVTILYLKYYFGNESLISLYGIIGILPTFLGALISKKITRWIGLKKNLIMSATIQIIFMFIATLVPASTLGISILMLVSFAAGLCNGISTPAQGLMMPATMDYLELKVGRNMNTFMGAISSLTSNFATALSGAITAGALSFIGYTPDVAPTGTMIWGIRVLMGVVPAVCMIPTLCVCFFNITEEKQKQIGIELIKRREQLQHGVLQEE